MHLQEYTESQLGFEKNFPTISQTGQINSLSLKDENSSHLGDEELADGEINDIKIRDES